MKGYTNYSMFAGDFAELIDKLQTAEGVVEEQLVAYVTAMHDANPEYSDRFLWVADSVELAALLDIGFGPDPEDPYPDYHPSYTTTFNWSY